MKVPYTFTPRNTLSLPHTYLAPVNVHVTWLSHTVFIYYYAVIFISYFQCHQYPVPPCVSIGVLWLTRVAQGQDVSNYFSFPLSTILPLFHIYIPFIYWRHYIIITSNKAITYIIPPPHR